MPRFKDQAICIRDLDWSETSQVVVLLTQQHGKVRGLAKGSKRQSPSSIARFSGGIELLTAGQVIATTRPSSDLASITEWDLQQDYFPLRRHLHAQRLAMYAADVCNALLADEDAHPQTFALLQTLLDELCHPVSAAGEPLPTPATPAGADALTGAEARGRSLLRFQWGVLTDGGYQPELDRDVRQGGSLAARATYSFDPIAGGLTTEPGLADWRVRAATVKTLRAVAVDEPLTQAQPADLERANRLLCVYLRAVLDKELPTMDVLLASRR